MSEPHTYIRGDEEGNIDVSYAYAANIGGWDKVAIDYGYRQFAPDVKGEAEQAELNKILAGADKAGQVFLTDEDARPLGSASPQAHLWDNGADPAAELQRVLTVRTAA